VEVHERDYWIALCDGYGLAKGKEGTWSGRAAKKERRGKRKDEERASLCRTQKGATWYFEECHDAKN
jgi:hypothetical protein